MEEIFNIKSGNLMNDGKSLNAVPNQESVTLISSYRDREIAIELNLAEVHNLVDFLMDYINNDL